MENVIFPSIGLKLKVSKIAFEFLNVNIYSYAICILLGMLIAFILCGKSKEKFSIKFECLVEILIFAIFFGILGARLYYVMFNLEYYMQNPIKIFAFRDGGLAIYGGLIAGSIVIAKRCKKMKINILDLLDYLAPFVAIAQSIGRWGNFFNVEAYGYETNSFFRMGINTIYGYQEVHPTFLYESICTFLIFIILRNLQKNRKFQSQIFLLYLMLYSIIRFFIEGLRVDSLMFFDLRISQVLSLGIFVVSSIIFCRNLLKYRSKKNT